MPGGGGGGDGDNSVTHPPLAPVTPLRTGWGELTGGLSVLALADALHLLPPADLEAPGAAGFRFPDVLEHQGPLSVAHRPQVLHLPSPPGTPRAPHHVAEHIFSRRSLFRSQTVTFQSFPHQLPGGGARRSQNALVVGPPGDVPPKNFEDTGELALARGLFPPHQDLGYRVHQLRQLLLTGPTPAGAGGARPGAAAVEEVGETLVA